MDKDEKDSIINVGCFDKFPDVLRKALESGKVKFPQDMQWKYKDMVAYRGIRICGNKKVLNRDDFKSYAEIDDSKRNGRLTSYSCSCFKDMKELKMAFRLPRKNKGIAEGFVKNKYGPIVLDNASGHIDWFLFENADPSRDFHIIEESEDE